MADATIANAYVQLMPSMKGFSGEVEKAIDSERVGERSGKSIGEAIGGGLKTAGKAIGSGLVAGTAMATVGLQQSVGAARDFEAAMAQVAATGGVSMEELNATVVSTSSAYGDFTGNLGEFAQFMGSSTAFSASQAAEALNYMALAGYDAQQSVDMLPTVLDLAAAGGMELASASDMVTDASAALGLDMEQTARMVDQMATAAANSNTSVAQLGEAYLTVGGTAKSLAGGTTELSTALGILADNGIKGSEGGTALRNIILSLGSPTDIAAAKMEELGLQVYDAEGNMRPLNETFGDLDAILSTMTEQERTEVLDTLFNKVDLKSANALLANSGERFDELSAAIDDCQGAASRMAETQLDNLEGDVTIFKSALEGLEIEIGSRITPKLRTFVQTGTVGLSTITDALKEGGPAAAFAQLDDVLKASIVTIGSMAGKTDEVWAAFDTVDGAVTRATSAYRTMAPALASTRDLAKASFSTASTAVQAFAKAASPAKDAIAGVFGRSGDAGSPASRAAELASGISDLAERVTGLSASAESAGEWLGERVASAAQFAADGISLISDKVGEVDFSAIAQRAGEIASTIGDTMSTAGDTLAGAWATVSDKIDLSALPSLKDVTAFISDTAIPAVQSFADDPLGSLQAALGSVKSKAAEFGDSAKTALETKFPNATSAAQTVADSFKENFGGVWDAVSSSFGTAWETVTGSLGDEGFSSTVDAITGKFETFGPLVETAATVLGGMAETSIPAVVSAVETYENTVGPIRDAVVGVITDTLPSAQSALESLVSPIDNVFDALNDSEITGGVVDLINTAGENLPGLVESVGTLGGGVLDGIASAVETASPHARATLASIGSFVSKNAGKFQDFIDNISPLMEPLGTALGSVAGGAADLAAAVVDWASDKAGEILDWANGVDWSSVATDIEGFGTAVGGLGTAIGDGITSGEFSELNDWIDTYILNPINDAATSIGTDIGKWWDDHASEPVNTFVSNVGGAWDDITEDAATEWASITTALGGTWENIQETAAPAWEAIQGAIQDPIGAAKDAIVGEDGFVSKIADKLNDMGIDDATINQLFTTIGGYISDPISTAKAAIADPQGFAAEIKGKLEDMGIDTDAILGVFNGVASAISGPIDGAWTAVGQAVSGIMNLVNGVQEWIGQRAAEINQAVAEIQGAESKTYASGTAAARTGGGGNSFTWNAEGGIFTGPTLGWIGEAGTEAVVPLSNRAYVRPFAQAVADEFSLVQGGGSSYNVTVNLQYGADANATAVAYDIARALGSRLRMEGAYGR